MSDKFKVGDIVVLKSGGPKMTVVDRDREPNPLTGLRLVHTTWFSGRKSENGAYPEDAIEMASNEKPA